MLSDKDHTTTHYLSNEDEVVFLKVVLGYCFKQYPNTTFKNTTSPSFLCLEFFPETKNKYKLHLYTELNTNNISIHLTRPNNTSLWTIFLICYIKK